MRQPTDLTAPGAVLLVSCYELGHQPLSLAFPLAVLRGAGYDPAVVDTSIDTLDDETIARARLRRDLGPDAHGATAGH